MSQTVSVSPTARLSPWTTSTTGSSSAKVFRHGMTSTPALMSTPRSIRIVKGVLSPNNGFGSFHPGEGLLAADGSGSCSPVVLKRKIESRYLDHFPDAKDLIREEREKKEKKNRVKKLKRKARYDAKRKMHEAEEEEEEEEADQPDKAEIGSQRRASRDVHDNEVSPKKVMTSVKNVVSVLPSPVAHAKVTDSPAEHNEIIHHPTTPKKRDTFVRKIPTPEIDESEVHCITSWDELVHVIEVLSKENEMEKDGKKRELKRQAPETQLPQYAIHFYSSTFQKGQFSLLCEIISHFFRHSLYSLDLGSCNLTDDEITDLITALTVSEESHEAVKNRKSRSRRKRRHSNEFQLSPIPIRKLLLGGNNILDSGATSIAGYVQLNNNLMMLNLRYNNIGDRGAKYLAKAIVSHRSLQEIDISCNQISRTGTKRLLKAFSSNQVLRRVRYIGNNMMGCENQLGDFVKNSHRIEELDLWCSRIGIRGAVLMANALTNRASNLITLKIGCNEISDRGAVAIANALHINVHLKIIDLSDNEITDEGGEALALALDKNRQLVNLNLAENCLSLRSCMALIREIRDHPTMRHLSLMNNSKLTENDCERVLDMFAAYRRSDNYSRASILMSPSKSNQSKDDVDKWTVNSPLRSMMGKHLELYSPILPPKDAPNLQRRDLIIESQLPMEIHDKSHTRYNRNGEFSVSPVLPERALKLDSTERSLAQDIVGHLETPTVRSIREDTEDSTRADNGEHVSGLLKIIDKTLTTQNRRLKETFSPKSSPRQSSITVKDVSKSPRYENSPGSEPRNTAKNHITPVNDSPSHKSKILFRMRQLSEQHNTISNDHNSVHRSLRSLTMVRDRSAKTSSNPSHSIRKQLKNKSSSLQGHSPNAFVEMLKERGFITSPTHSDVDHSTITQWQEQQAARQTNDLSETNGMPNHTATTSSSRHPVDGQLVTPDINNRQRSSLLSAYADDEQKDPTVDVQQDTQQALHSLESEALSPKLLSLIAKRSQGRQFREVDTGQSEDTHSSIESEGNSSSFPSPLDKPRRSSLSPRFLSLSVPHNPHAESDSNLRRSLSPTNAAILNPKVRKSLGIHSPLTSVAPPEQVDAMNDPLAKKNLTKRRYSFLVSVDQMTPTLLPDKRGKSSGSKITVDLESNGTIKVTKRRMVVAPKVLYTTKISDVDARVVLDAADPHAFTLILRRHTADDESNPEERKFVFRAKSLAKRDEFASTLNAFIYKNRHGNQGNDSSGDDDAQNLTGLDMDGDDESIHTSISEVKVRRSPSTESIETAGIYTAQSTETERITSPEVKESSMEEAIKDAGHVQTTKQHVTVRALVTRERGPRGTLPMEKGMEFEVLRGDASKSSRGWIHVRNLQDQQDGYVRRYDVEFA